ncbi:MAG: hypothetical protein HY823_05445 [Acidobacteria bacterium]|nr:hypothetical protein [Acidobacteriota bacterium]
MILACGGGGGGGTPPSPAPSISSFTASPATITAGGSSTLAWAVSGANSLSIDPGVGPVSGTSKSVSPAATTTYTLTASNGGGNATATATVTVVAPPVITAFAANPSVITTGGSTTLSWTVTGATTLNIDQGVGTVSGSSKVLTPNGTTTYTLTATNAAGSTASATATVTVVPPPAITSFAANPAAITAGQSSTLAWTATGAAAFSLDQGIGPVAGTSRVVSPTATTTYTLTATNAAGTAATAQTTIAVSARTTQVTLTLKVADTATNATWAAVQDGDANAPWQTITGTGGTYTFTLQDPSGMFGVALAYKGGPVVEALTQVVRATVRDLDAAAGAPSEAGGAQVNRNLSVRLRSFDTDTLSTAPLNTLSGTFSGLVDGHQEVNVFAYNKTRGFCRTLGYRGNGAWSMNLPPGMYDVGLQRVSFPVVVPQAMKILRNVDLTQGGKVLAGENASAWDAQGSVPLSVSAMAPSGAGALFGRGTFMVDGAPDTFTLNGMPAGGMDLGYGNASPFAFLSPAGGTWGPQDVGQLDVQAYNGNFTKFTQCKVFWNPAINSPPAMLPLADLLPDAVVTDLPVPGGYSRASFEFPGGFWIPRLRDTQQVQWHSIETRTPGVADTLTFQSRDYNDSVLAKFGPHGMDSVTQPDLNAAGRPPAFETPAAIAHTATVTADNSTNLIRFLEDIFVGRPPTKTPEFTLVNLVQAVTIRYYF